VILERYELLRYPEGTIFSPEDLEKIIGRWKWRRGTLKVRIMDYFDIVRKQNKVVYLGTASHSGKNTYNNAFLLVLLEKGIRKEDSPVKLISRTAVESGMEDQVKREYFLFLVPTTLSFKGGK